MYHPDDNYDNYVDPSMTPAGPAPDGLGDPNREECMEHDDPAECEGTINYYPSLSGSGESYPRCEKGYRQYVDRVQPRMDEIRSRYPDTPTPPAWFDPSYAGEAWDAD